MSKFVLQYKYHKGIYHKNIFSNTDVLAEAKTFKHKWIAGIYKVIFGLYEIVEIFNLDNK